jgi:hypothetical protein
MSTSSTKRKPSVGLNPTSDDIKAQNPLQSNFNADNDDTSSMDSDERYLVRINGP